MSQDELLSQVGGAEWSGVLAGVEWSGGPVLKDTNMDLWWVRGSNVGGRWWELAFDLL